jgi:putative NADH-flavin reductase
MKGLPMRILVFGASGQAGNELVRQAVEHGHSVSAFVRTPTKREFASSVSIFQGDVADAEMVKAAVRGHDAVVSALGVTTPLKHDPAVIAGVQHIVRAMEEHDVRRLIYLSFVGVRESRSAVGFVLRYIAPIPLRHEIADHEAKEAVIRNSGLDWTIVRAPKLTNGPRTEKYRSGDDIKTLTPVPMMSRADVAHFIIRELEDSQYVRRSPRLLR